MTISGTGANADEPEPSYLALSFKLQRPTRATKSGGKRIGGLSESWVSGNAVWTDPIIQARIEAYAEVLDDVLVGATTTWTPVLVKFDPLNPSVVLADQIVASGSFNYLTTQNSRKPER
jgi:hypothetical protein